jgi:3-methylfumaryl-CoA hydratase
MTEWPSWTAGWTPAVEQLTTTVAPNPVAGLAAMLDTDPAIAEPGSPLPVLWHWVALSAWPLGSAVGPDGHPEPGGFLPPTPYSRRMWLGASLEVAGEPIIGTDVLVERTVSDVVEKSGTMGAFAIITVTTDIRTTTGEPLLLERNQFAYRSPASGAPPTASMPDAQGVRNPWFIRSADGWQFTPDPVLLMRYSALSANGHRIHYDVPYVTEVEGYPNLLVHGPLMATMLAEAVRRDYPDREVTHFACRATRPFFLGISTTIRSTTNGETMSLELRDDSALDGAVFMTAEVALR